METISLAYDQMELARSDFYHVCYGSSFWHVGITIPKREQVLEINHEAIYEIALMMRKKLQRLRC